MNFFIFMMFSSLMTFAVFLLLMYRGKIKRLEEVLGAQFVNTVTRGGDGILTAVISNQDIDFLFFPITRRDDRFYYVEFPLPSKKGVRREHFKIAKEDVFLLRNRLLFAFLLRDKMRAINLDHIKTMEILDEEQKQELIEDYVEYQALQNQYKNISSEMLRATSPQKLQELQNEREKIRTQMEEIKKKWSIIIGTLPREKAMLIQDDEDENYYHILRSINFEEFADAMTGVRPNEIYDTALSMYKRWVIEFLKDFSKAFRIPSTQGGSSGLFFLLVGGMVFMIAMILVIRAFGGG